MNFDRGNILDDIGKFLADRLDSVEDDELDFFIDNDQPEEDTDALLESLNEQYKNLSLDQVFGGVRRSNDYGSFYLIERKEKMSLPLVPQDIAKQILSRDLKLIYGIREATEDRLKAGGIFSVYDLINHPRYGTYARQVAKAIDNWNFEELSALIVNRFKIYSAEEMLYCAALFDHSDFLFFDLETMGLFHRPIILFGTAYLQEGYLNIVQILVESFENEPAALFEFLKLLNTKKALVSFNGRSFDWNYILQRLTYNSLPLPEEKPHFDIYHFARRRWKNLENHRLQTLEAHLLNIRRKDDVPGELIPQFYETYVSTGNIGPLVPIITHNQQDLISSALIFGLLQKSLSDD